MDHPHAAHEDIEQIEMVVARGIEPLLPGSVPGPSVPRQDAPKCDTCAPRTSEWIGVGSEDRCDKARHPLGDPASTKQLKGSQTADAELARLMALWTSLSTRDRAAIVALAHSLGAQGL